MIEAKFTPGPWTIQPDPEFKHLHPYHDYRFITNGAKFESFSENHGWILDREDGEIICEMRDCQNQVANAHLIAAAPDLLEALNGCVTEDNDPCLIHQGNRELELVKRIKTINSIAQLAIKISTNP